MNSTLIITFIPIEIKCLNCLIMRIIAGMANGVYGTFLESAVAESPPGIKGFHYINHTKKCRTNYKKKTIVKNERIGRIQNVDGKCFPI